MDLKLLRNFAIIAHIDHGKSTLSDRLLEMTGSLTAREMQAQVLDAMDLERERGITIKAHAVRMMYKARDGVTYQLNLIDTPGHVDFSYEVSRSLASCEGALLVVDASQGVEAQTLANAFLAINGGLEIIPVINKIDLPSADITRTQEAIEAAVGLDATDAIAVSAKTGQGMEEVLEAIVHRLPHPKGELDAPLQALIFDSWFDPYRGVVVLARVVNGRMYKGQRVRFMANGTTHLIEAMGVLTPKPVAIDALTAGEVGFFTATIKNVADTKIGDTVTDVDEPATEALPGFLEIMPMVFAGLYTVDSHEHTLLRDALEKLRLNDSSFFFEPESSVALGFGFRCGFLGLLHMEIIQERIEREYNLDLITTGRLADDICMSCHQVGDARVLQPGKPLSGPPRKGFGFGAGIRGPLGTPKRQKPAQSPSPKVAMVELHTLRAVRYEEVPVMPAKSSIAGSPQSENPPVRSDWQYSSASLNTTAESLIWVVHISPVLELTHTPTAS